MARVFTFKSLEPEDADDRTYHTNLDTRQCDSRNTASGARCKNHVTMGVPYCNIHWKKDFGLRSQESEIDGAGLGVFAFGGNNQDNDYVVFQTGDEITEYLGERIDEEELDRRYGHATAPYTEETSRRLVGGRFKRFKRFFIDAAGYRCMASLINHDAQTPNVEAVRHIDAQGRETGRILIVALRNITHDEELLLDYGPEYRFDDHVKATTYLSNYKRHEGNKKYHAAVNALLRKNRLPLEVFNNPEGGEQPLSGYMGQIQHMFRDNVEAPAVAPAAAPAAPVVQPELPPLNQHEIDAVRDEADYLLWFNRVGDGRSSGRGSGNGSGTASVNGPGRAGRNLVRIRDAAGRGRPVSANAPLSYGASSSVVFR